jgi:hypothetical protein
MSTQGNIVFILNDLYYIYYNNFKSYPSNLGCSIINNLTSLFSNNGYNYILEYLKEKINKIPESMKEQDETHGSSRFGGILDILSYPQDYVFKTTKIMPHCSNNIEWIYTIDLDNNKFLAENIDRVYSFDLCKINSSIFIKEINRLYNNNIDIDLSDDDTTSDINLKIKILETQNKIYKMQLKLNKN